MNKREEDDVALKLLHTADWHLGRRFRTFSGTYEEKLTRARAEVLDNIFGMAERHAVNAVLCAGDLFESHAPSEEWWQALLGRLERLRWSDRPIFLLPGNHDPLLPESVWDPRHPFRRGLPDFVHVVDRDDFTYPLTPEATLFARPCRSKSGQDDLALALPARASGDESIRIGMVHGSTFDIDGAQTNFPIDRDAVVKRGFDYLAVGDTHGFRFVPPEREVPPTIYPGAPEATAFDERDPGHVAVVFMSRRRRARVQKERVAKWTWEEVRVSSLEELEALRDRRDLESRVLRLRLSMRLPPDRFARAEQVLRELEGDLASHGLVGVLDLDRSGLVLDSTDIQAAFDGLPDVVKAAAQRLKEAQTTAEDPEVPRRALYHLYQLARRAG